LAIPSIRPGDDREQRLVGLRSAADLMSTGGLDATETGDRVAVMEWQIHRWFNSPEAQDYRT